MTTTRQAQGSAEMAGPLVWDAATIKRFWDYHSRFPELYFAAQFGESLVRTIARAVPRGARVLDYACGTGGLTGLMLGRGLRVAACDLSSESLDAVRAQFGDHPGFLGAFAVDELPSVRETFHAITLVEVIEHVDDDVLALMFRQVRERLAPDGVAIVTTPNDENLQSDTVFCPCCNHTFHRWQHIRSWSAGTLAQLFRAQGLVPERVFATDFSLRGTAQRLLRPILRRLRGVRQPHLVGIARNKDRSAP